MLLPPQESITSPISSRIATQTQVTSERYNPQALLDTKRPFNQTIASIIVQALVIRRSPFLCERLTQYFAEISPLSCSLFFNLPEINETALSELENLATTILPLPEVQSKLAGVPLYFALKQCEEAPQ